VFVDVKVAVVMLTGGVIVVLLVERTVLNSVTVSVLEMKAVEGITSVVVTVLKAEDVSL
jgi:hypothetical protein